MTIWKRLKNLWKLSEIEVFTQNQKAEELTDFLFKEKKMATIIKLEPDLDKFLQK